MTFPRNSVLGGYFCGRMKLRPEQVYPKGGFFHAYIELEGAYRCN